MHKFLAVAALLCISLPSFSQQININVCNETNNIAARNSCVKGYLETLIVNEFELLAKPLDSAMVTLKLSIDPVGNMTPVFFDTNQPELRDATQRAINKVFPLDTFSNDKGEFLIDEIDITLKAPFPAIADNKSGNETVKKDTDSSKADVDFSVIEKVPVFPGCYQTENVALKNCMSSFVQKHVANNFNTNLARNLGLPVGRVRISVQFKIDCNGYVVGVRSRAPRIELEEEAIRVVQALPKMQAGKQRGEAVGVLYSLPILFQVEK